MSSAVVYLVNQASVEQIANHLALCDSQFVPPISERVDVAVYARKIADNGVRFEAWIDASLVALVAAYFNDSTTLTAFVTSVSVVEGWTKKGIGAKLLSQCIAHAEKVGMRQVRLKVGQRNARARRLYAKSGFTADQIHGEFIEMTVNLKVENK
jgi:GNAT superfamily N-acetyltransferase